MPHFVKDQEVWVLQLLGWEPGIYVQLCRSTTTPTHAVRFNGGWAFYEDSKIRTNDEHAALCLTL